MSLFTKKTWADRVSEFANRRVLTKANNTTETVTVARSEGTVTTEGDAFSAANMNAMEGRIEAAFNIVDGLIGGRESVALTVAGWASSNGNTDYYEQTKSLTNTHTDNANVLPKYVGTLPTNLEETNFRKVLYARINDNHNEVTFYCTTKPSATVDVYVVG